MNAFDEFFTFHCSNKKYITKDGKTKISFCDKVKLISKCYIDDNLQRLIEKGDRRLVKELDMCRILTDIKSIHAELNKNLGLRFRE